MPASRPRVALLLILGACGYVAFSLPLRPSFANVAFPTERWDGVFRSDDSHRGGSLTVRFDFRTDTASGVRTGGIDTLLAHVTLAPGMTGPVIAADAKDPEHLRHSDAPEVLHATIVLGPRGKMGGELEAYVDPDCDCVVVTRFTGIVVGAVAEGLYETRGPGVQRGGRWRVRRTVIAE